MFRGENIMKWRKYLDLLRRAETIVLAATKFILLLILLLKLIMSEISKLIT